MNVPPAILKTRDPIIGLADSIPKPIAHPSDSVKANPNYTKREIQADVFFYFKADPNETAITN